MKILIVYYSKTGNTKIIAEELGKNLTADIKTITETQPKQGIVGYILDIKDAALQQGSSINDLAYQVDNYDLIIIGTPVWAWTMSNPVRTFLQKYKQNLKKVAFFATMKKNGDQRTFSHMSELSGLTPLATISFTDSNIKQANFKTALLNFVEEIKKKLAG